MATWHVCAHRSPLMHLSNLPATNQYPHLQVKIWFQNRRAKDRKQKRKKDDNCGKASKNGDKSSDSSMNSSNGRSSNHNGQSMMGGGHATPVISHALLSSPSSLNSHEYSQVNIHNHHSPLSNVTRQLLAGSHGQLMYWSVAPSVSTEHNNRILINLLPSPIVPFLSSFACFYLFSLLPLIQDLIVNLSNRSIFIRNSFHHCTYLVDHLISHWNLLFPL